MTKTFSRKISIYTFVMSVLIVLYHVSVFNSYNIILGTNLEATIYGVCRKLFDNLAAISLGFFFMTSAYLMYQSADNNTIYVKVKKRLFTLGVPFVFWNIVEFVFLYFVRQLGTITILSFSLDPFDGPLWYVFALLILSAMSPVILKLKKLQKKFVLMIFVVIVVASSIFCLAYNNKLCFEGLYWLERVVRYLPAYFSGVLLAWYGDKITKESYNKNTVEHVARIFTILGILIVLVFNSSEENVLTYLILRLLPVSVWFCFHCSSEERINSFPMKISFVLYAIHDMIVRIIGWGFHKVLNTDSICGYQFIMFRVLSLLIIYCIALCVAYVVKKFIPKLYVIMTGGR